MLTNVVFAGSVAYLLGRTAVQVRRQQLSYDKLPFPSPDFEIPAGLDREVGALVGIAVGDALGAAREALPPALCRLRYGPEPKLSRGVVRFMRRRGTITDDTQHTWLVARAITADGFDERLFADSLADWMRWRIGPGRGTERAIRGNPDPRSEGNGAAMRVAPLVLAFRDEALAEAVAAASSVTHPAEGAIHGAQLVAILTQAYLRDGPVPDDPCLLDAKLTRTGGWVVETVAGAHALFVEYQANWQAALTELYRVGGDTDTVGAILCSFVGAKYGASVFGVDLLRQIQGTEVLANEAARLADF
jgi:ADP-ribosyl-[dinitrogen reductase] hydrolase